MDSNGQQLPEQPLAQSPPPVNPLLVHAHNSVRMSVETLVRGLIASNPGQPPAAMLTMIAWYLGNFTASTVQGDLDSLLRLRKGLQEAFKTGVQAVKLAPSAPPPLRPQTAPPPPVAPQ